MIVLQDDEVVVLKDYDETKLTLLCSAIDQEAV